MDFFISDEFFASPRQTAQRLYLLDRKKAERINEGLPVAGTR